MEVAPQDLMRIALAPERLDEGAPEEHATFGLLRITASDRLLTEGHDAFIDGRRDGPLVSGYHLAEWLVANWWRLRHEPRPSGRPPCDWRMTHCMAEIGEGYVWPSITIESDGFRSVVRSDPSEDRAAPFRFQGSLHPALLPWMEVERAIDAFVDRVVALTRERGVGETNLDRLWRDLTAERSDPALGRYRRFEALMGCDPDETDEGEVLAHLADEAWLGEEGLDELAAVGGGPGAIPRAADIADAAARMGVEAHLDQVPIAKKTPKWGTDQAWRIGVAAALELRGELGFDDRPITNEEMAGLVDVPATLLEGQPEAAPLSFALAQGDVKDRIALRSRHPVARRFDLARLIGDRAIHPDGPFRPAIRANSYRQQAQRAFAAEFLAPIAAVVAMAEGDLSPDRQLEIAHEFDVSEMTINGLLKNNHYIDRDAADFGYAA